MVRIEGEIAVDRSVEEVFDFVADERNEPRYNPRMLRAEKISLGPIGVGKMDVRGTLRLKRLLEAQEASLPAADERRSAT